MKKILLLLASTWLLTACQTTVSSKQQVSAPAYPLVPTTQVGCNVGEKALDCDRRAILAMAGEYQVDFHFEEVAGFRAGYELHKPHDSRGFEFIKVLEDSCTRVVLQHVLVSKDGEVVKHWRQDWQYEQATTWQYVGDRQWQRRLIPQADLPGTWTQTVWQVDDSPRYAGFGRWQHQSNVSSWVSDETWRPLPRREFTTRSDYDVLVAVNRQEITATGWLHLQDNLKLDRKASGNQRYIAREVGVDRYTRISGYDFANGYDYWAKTASFWQAVRQSWSARFAAAEKIHIAEKLNDKTLWMVLFDRAEQALPTTDSDLKSEIDQILDRYLNAADAKSEATLVTAKE